MDAITFEQAAERLALWREALAEVSAGRTFKIGTRTFAGFDLAEIRAHLAFWRDQAARLKAAPTAEDLRARLAAARAAYSNVVTAGRARFDGVEYRPRNVAALLDTIAELDLRVRRSATRRRVLDPGLGARAEGQ